MHSIFITNLILKNDANILITNFKKDELNFSFRKSFFQNKNYLILNVNFHIPEKNFIGETETYLKMEKIIDIRNNTQEKKLPNLGSIFGTKNLYRDLKNKNIIFYLNNIYTAHFHLTLLQ